jgi:hypothetical protein
MKLSVTHAWYLNDLIHGRKCSNFSGEVFVRDQADVAGLLYTCIRNYVDWKLKLERTRSAKFLILFLSSSKFSEICDI